MPKTRIAPLLIVVLCAGGCADTLNVTGNETFVVVAPTGSVSAALPLAEKHCATYGKVAHFNHMDGFRVVFDCETEGAR